MRLPHKELLGRGALLERLDRLLVPGARLCLWGPPGVGKSAVAAAYAELVGEAGALSVTVEPTDADLRDAVARALGRANAEADLVALLAEAGPLLVCVDPLEHGELPEWQPPPRLELPEVSWLVCARRQLAGWPGLRVPTLTVEAGVALWRQLVPAAEDPEALIVELVGLLDGLPLGLKLAARRRRLLPLPVLLPRLRDSIEVLGDQAQGRQRLESAVLEALSSLSPAALTALSSLGVSRGELPLAAAEAILAPLGDPLDLLTALHDASLIALDTLGHSAKVFRWVRPHLTPPSEQARAAWQGWRVALSEAWATQHPASPTPAELSALRDLTEQPSLSPTLRLRLAVALRGRVQPALLHRLVEDLRPDALQPEDRDALLRAQVLALECVGELERAHALLAANPERVRAADLHSAWAFVLDREGHTEQALGWIDACLAEPLTDAQRADLLWFSAWLRWWCRDEDAAALELLGAAQRLYPDRPDCTLRARFLELSILAGQGQVHLAQAAHGRLLEEAERSGYTLITLEGRLNFASQLLYQGHLDLAYKAAAEALPVAHALGSTAAVAAAHTALAWVAGQHGQVDAAISHIHRGLTACRAVGVRRSEAHLLLELAMLQARCGRPDAAAQALQGARERLLPRNRYGEGGLTDIAEGFVALAQARARGDAKVPEGARAALTAGEGAPRFPRDAIRARLAAALAEDSAAELTHGQLTHGQLTRSQLTVGPEGRWFQLDDGPPVDLRRSRNQRRLLDALARCREDGGEGLQMEAVVATLWPGERILRQAARHRVHVAVSSLRRAGLASMLLHTPDGYCLQVPGGVARSEVPTPEALRG